MNNSIAFPIVGNFLTATPGMLHQSGAEFGAESVRNEKRFDSWINSVLKHFQDWLDKKKIISLTTYSYVLCGSFSAL